MKTRNGFVSNSSSSSFVVIVSEKMYKRALVECSEYGEAVVKDLLRGPEKIKLDGNEYFMWLGSYSTDEFACNVEYPKKKAKPDADGFVPLEEDDDYYEHCEEAQEQWNQFLERVNELGGVAREEQC